MIKEILDKDDILNEQFGEIWQSFKSNISSSNFDYDTLISSTFKFLKELSGFVQMLFNFARLPEVEKPHNFLENNSRIEEIREEED